jgi:hypothetical protein
VQQFIDLVEGGRCQDPLTGRILQEHMPEKFHVIKMLERLPVSVGCTENEFTCIETTIPLPGAVKCLTKTFID